MNIQIASRPATFATGLPLAPVSLNAALPHVVLFFRTIVVSTYRSVVALARTVATLSQSILGNLVSLAAKLAHEREFVPVPSTGFLAIGAVTAGNRAEHALSIAERFSADTVHLHILLIAATTGKGKNNANT